MLAKVWSAAVCGIEGYLVTVELDLANGLPNYTTVGLPDSAVRESRERVVSAIRNSGFDFPNRRVTVNLAPAELKKRGTQFDLPVALGLLAASGQLPPGDWMRRYCFLGELALDGTVKPVSGVLPMAVSAKTLGIEGVVVPKPNASEAAQSGARCLGAASLREAAQFLSGRIQLTSESVQKSIRPYESVADLSEVKGQHAGKRALEVAAAGGHHLMLVGTPGTGKSMLAQRLPGILPELSEQELLEVSKVRSVVAQVQNESLFSLTRPFRAPHYTATAVALMGGGSPCRPGEVSFAHGGVLFLDEFPEFGRAVLETLRVPLETGIAAVSRLRDSARFPARFQLVAAMNPCSCGWLGHPKRLCSCSPNQISAYRSRISGPLLDRIDLQVEISPLTFAQWNEAGDVHGERSEIVRGRVMRAREIQAHRLPDTCLNSRMTPADIKRYCAPTQDGISLLEAAAVRLGLSARSLDRVLKISRTIADLEQSGLIQRTHVAEALSLSGRERWYGLGQETAT